VRCLLRDRLLALSIVVPLLFTASAQAQTSAVALDPPEIRALWVDAFHAGIRSPAEVNALVDAARQANLNTLFVQVRRRGDALYTRGVEPPLDDSAYDPSFDALEAIVEAGHRAGLQVHAWVNAMPAWRDEPPPKDARHVFNAHGPSAAGEDNWFTATPSGNLKFPVGYFLDPGHPAAADYLAGIYRDIVRHYAVDGIHFDYIRYPETDERLPRGAGVGYNPVSLARFHRATGRAGVPAPDDEGWMNWRRTQVTNLVRRISAEARALKPGIKISAALIPWGEPPANEKDFEDVAPMQRVYQDWHAWMRDGLLDLAVPMNYASETDSRVRGWFDGWIRWEKRHKHGRQLAIGLGAYRNTPEATLLQVARSRRVDGGARADGVSFFSYAVPTAVQDGETTHAGLAFLAQGTANAAPAFARPAAVPPMPWLEHPERGWIAGTVTAGTRAETDGVTVKLRRTGFRLFRRTRSVETDGNGHFALSNLKPGRYRVWMAGVKRAPVMVEVAAGAVARADLMRMP
jgi:uncharacterized lipoprotein YddW (UPF0748 family)